MRTLIFLLFLQPLSAVGQFGFSEGWRFDGNTVFENMLINRDTIILHGLVAEPGASVTSKVCLKIDTLGNILNKAVYYDPFGNSFQYTDNAGIIKLQNSSGCAISASTNCLSQLLFLTNEGFVHHISRFEDSSAIWNPFNVILETPKGI